MQNSTSNVNGIALKIAVENSSVKIISYILALTYTMIPLTIQFDALKSAREFRITSASSYRIKVTHNICFLDENTLHTLDFYNI